MDDAQPRSPRRNLAFTGIPTFLRSPLVEDLTQLDADWAVLGAPYDEGSPFAPGSRFGPRSIREHSLRFRNSGLYDSATRRPVLTDFISGGGLVDVGDIDVLPSNPGATLENLTSTVRSILARGARPLVIGGDHAVSFPVIAAFSEQIHVIQLDAHTDYMPVSAEIQHSNGQGFRKIHGLPHVASLTQIGIRGLRNYASDIRDAEAAGSRIIHMPDIRRSSPEALLEHIPRGAPVYVSIDIDAYDLSLTPGCVSAEPGGLTWEDMTGILQAIAARASVRGFDLVEVNPMLDVATGVTSYLGAMTIIQFLAYLTPEPAAA